MGSDERFVVDRTATNHAAIGSHLSEICREVGDRLHRDFMQTQEHLVAQAVRRLAGGSTKGLSWRPGAQLAEQVLWYRDEPIGSVWLKHVEKSDQITLQVLGQESGVLLQSILDDPFCDGSGPVAGIIGFHENGEAFIRSLDAALDAGRRRG